MNTRRLTKKPPPQKPSRNPNELVGKRKPDQTPDDAMAQLAIAGLASNTAAMREWSAYRFGDVGTTLDLTTCLNAIVDAAERVKRCDLGDAEALLTAQAVTLNALFANLAHRSHESKYLDHFDRYMRLALKAQTQCRATVETLAAIKNPPTVFARQANIANGPQQVNNALAPSRAAILEARRNGPA